MGSYFLKINPLSFASLRSLHRRMIISSLHQLHVPDRQSIVQGDLTDSQPAPNQTPSTTPSPSTHWELHLSVTPTFGNRTHSTSSREWKALRTKILLRDNRTCSSCGYVSPYPHARCMVIDHIDGDASNNDLSNLRIHCPPCDAIRHCGFSGLQDWITVSESTMAQVEIVRKTRKIFENTGDIPPPFRIDPSVKPGGISVIEFANMLIKTPWKDLPKESHWHRLRGFFTENSLGLFQKTTSARDLKTVSTWKPGISYSEERHGTGQEFVDLWLPSKTLKSKAPWISVDDHQSAESKDDYDLERLSRAWAEICAEGLPTLSKVDNLAEHLNVLSGKWLVFASSDEVDDLWEGIVKSTIAGTLGMSAKVSTRDGNDPPRHVICIKNADYRLLSEVTRIRDELRRLGVVKPIAYKPDIYTHCRIFTDNSWGIRPSRYYF